jgi:RHS repeat-associated protein
VPANAEDIVYLVNQGQIGRTRHFSSSSPQWAQAGSIQGLIYDAILDPGDPYYSAWVVGSTGIWRTTNLDASSPSWVHVQTMNQITTSIQSQGTVCNGHGDPDGVVRIIGDASRLGYFLVVLGCSLWGPSGSGWVGWTSNYGTKWTWTQLPAAIQGIEMGQWTSASLTMSQDGTGQIWIGGGNGNGGNPTNYIVYSGDYGQNWQVVWSATGNGIPNPSSLYYSRGTLYSAMGTHLARSVDNGKTWTFLSAVGPTYHIPTGINGFPQSSQLIYYVAANGSLQYSIDGGNNFITQSLSAFPGKDPAAVTIWLDNPNAMAWSLQSPGPYTGYPVIKYSADAGLSWNDDKTGDWYSVFGNWAGRSDNYVWSSMPILIPSQVQHLRDLYLKGKLCDCNLTTAGGTRNFVNDPIDTSNGNLSYQVKDISVPSLGNNLYFQRSYASSSNNITTSIGYGWTDNFETKIVGLPSPLTTTTHPITLGLQTSNGSQLLFFHIISGTYAPDFGVTAYLTRTAAGNTAAYTLTDKSQTVYTFNLTGSLISKRDALGHSTIYSYTLANTLTQVTDVGTGRWLKFNTDSARRVVSITDNINRWIGFTYNITGDLTIFTDTRNLAWTYVYTGSHLLWKVIDPDAKTVIRTEYDSQGRAIQQFDGLNNKTVELNFGNGITTTLIDARGNSSIDTYARGTWINAANAAGSVITRNYDLNFRPVYLADANGSPTKMQWSDDGSNLEQMVNAAGLTTTLIYDALNHPILITDTRNLTTSYTYSGNLLTRQSDALGNTTIYTYGPNNLLIAQQDALGHITRYGYDPLNQRIAITDALTNVTRYAYDAAGRLITTTDALGRMTVNGYDKADHLITVTNNYTSTTAQPNYLNAYNLITRYAYDGSGRQILITDTLSSVSRNGYDAAGRLVSSTTNYSPTIGQNAFNTYNLITRYGYDAAGNQVRVTDTLTHVTKTDYDKLNRPITVTTNYVNGVFDSNEPDKDVMRTTAYDAAGNTTDATDGLGRVTHTWYDNLNRVISVSTNYSPTVGPNYLNTYNLVTRYGYDAAGNQLLVTDTLGHITRNYYDALNRVISTTVNYTTATGTPNYLNQYNLITKYMYDKVGNRIVVTDPMGNPTTYAYDVLNRVMTTTNALSGRSVTVYDALGNRIKSIDALTHTQVYTYDLAGRLIAQADALGNATTYQYDALGRTIVVTDALSHATRTFYDPAGRVVSTTNALTGTSVIIYDALGRRVGFIDENSKSSYMLYDGLGRTIAVTDATGIPLYTVYDALGNRVKSIDALQHTTVYTYDTANRLIAQADPLSNITRYQYDALGNRLVITDANGIATGYGYDALNRLSIVTESLTTTGGLDPNKYNLLTRYAYDPIGNRSVMTNARGYTTTYIYDALYRVTAMSDPLSHTTRYKYDAVGNQVVVTNANLTTTVYLYDALNRPTVITYTADAKTVKYAYDKVGNRTFMTDSLGVTRYVYDVLNRPIVITDPYTGPITYTYDLVGNRIGLIYPDGKVITSTYDAANRLLSVVNWAGQNTTYTYDQAGRLSTTTLPNGMTTINTYDAANQITRLTHNRAGDNVNVSDYQFTLDKLGNRTVTTETQGSAIFANGFESGNFSAWSAAVTNTGYLSISNLAAMSGAYGLMADVENTSPMYVRDDSPSNATVYHAQFNFDPNVGGGPQTSPDLIGPDAGGNDYHDIFVGRTGSLDVFRVQLEVVTTPPERYVRIEARRDDGTYVDSAWYYIGGPTLLSIDWRAADTGANNGELNLLEYGDVIETLSGLDNDTLRVDEVRLGPSAGIDSGIHDLEYFDDFVSSADNATNINYTYDPLYRLTSANYTGASTYAFAYAYDKVGNRTAQTATIGSTVVTTYTYDTANRMSKVGTTSNTWDNNGNLINDGSSLYRYDQANRLISTTLGSTTSLFNYNGDGVRLRQVVNGAVTTYTQDAVAPLPVVLQAKTNATTNQYLYSIGTRPVAQYGTTWEYLLSDGLGSVRQIADTNGNITLAKAYEPYGSILNSSGSTSSIFGFSGEQADTSGLIYLRARYMNPGLGIFLSHDPWSGDQMRPGSMNGFGYVEGDPINEVDPSGQGIGSEIMSSLSSFGNTNAAILIPLLACDLVDPSGNVAPIPLSLSVAIEGQPSTADAWGVKSSLDFGVPNNKGAHFVAKVLVPNSARGGIRLVQEIRSYRSITTLNEGRAGESVFHTYALRSDHSTHMWALDYADGPYYAGIHVANGQTSDPSPLERTIVKSNSFIPYLISQLNLESYDSPGIGALGQDLQKSRIEVNEDFRLYLIWEPDNGTPITLKIATWWWSAIATGSGGATRPSVTSWTAGHIDNLPPNGSRPIDTPRFKGDFNWYPVLKPSVSQ